MSKEPETLTEWFKSGGQGKTNPTSLETYQDWAFAKEVAEVTIQFMKQGLKPYGSMYEQDFYKLSKLWLGEK